jgi:hypothetical protein
MSPCDGPLVGGTVVAVSGAGPGARACSSPAWRARVDAAILSAGAALVVVRAPPPRRRRARSRCMLVFAPSVGAATGDADAYWPGARAAAARAVHGC